MALTIDEVRRIAGLARLRLSQEEEERFVAQLGDVVAYFDQLADFAAEKPKAAGLGEARERPDEVGDCLERERFLANAPDAREAFLQVPQVMADEADDG